MAEPIPPRVDAPIDEYGRKLFGGILDLRDFWRDRKRVLADPRCLRTWRANLTATPFIFATQSLFLPFLFVGGLFGLIGTFVELPPTLVDQNIAIQERLVSAYDDHQKHAQDRKPINPALAHLSEAELAKRRERVVAEIGKIPVPASSADELDRMVELTANLVAVIAAEQARSEVEINELISPIARDAAETRLRLLKYRKAIDFLKDWNEALIGTFFIASAYLFGWWCRRLKPPPAHAESAVASFLFAVGAVLFAPSCVFAILLAAEDMAGRYDWDWAIFVFIGSRALIVLWAGHRLATAGEWLQLVLEDHEDKSASRVGWIYVGVLIIAFVTAILGLEWMIKSLMLVVPAAAMNQA